MYPCNLEQLTNELNSLPHTLWTGKALQKMETVVKHFFSSVSPLLPSRKLQNWVSVLTDISSGTFSARTQLTGKNVWYEKHVRNIWEEPFPTSDHS